MGLDSCITLQTILNRFSPHRGLAATVLEVPVHEHRQALPGSLEHPHAILG
jgi:hypothetical protein